MQIGMQIGAQVREPTGGWGAGGHGRHDVGREALLAGPVLADDRQRLADLRVLQQRGLDLPQLDAEAADLDLLVGAAQELD